MPNCLSKNEFAATLCAYLIHNFTNAGVSLATVTVNSMQFASLPNISVVSASDVTNNKGVVCATALDQPDIGEWVLPTGTAVKGSGTTDPLYVLSRTGRVDLYRRRDLPESLEGIYTCNVPNEDSVMQVLYIGIYSSPGRYCMCDT